MKIDFKWEILTQLFFFPPHLPPTAAELDSEFGQSVEYDANDDDEDFVVLMNRLVPAGDDERELTAEVLESYIDFFEKTYLFSKETSKLPVKPVLLRQHSEQRCILCDFTDPEQAVLECRSCGIMVHSACYHDVLYATLAPGSDSNSQNSKPNSRTTTRSRKAATASKDSSKSAETPKRGRGRRNATAMDVDEEEILPTKTQVLSSRTRSHARPVPSSSSMDLDESDSQQDADMNPDEGEKTNSELLDVYSAPFADKVHDDGTWWCAKCSSDDPEKPSCELCGCSNGALFPRFILDEAGKPRILSRRRPFMPNQPPKEAAESENGETTQNTNTNSAVAAAALYTPIHFRNWRASPTRRRGRRPRTTTSAHSEPEDVVWFHDICSRSKPLFYQHIIDPTHIDDEDELAIPASDDEEDSPKSDEISSKSGHSTESPSKTSKSKSAKSKPPPARATPSRSRSVEKKAKVMHGDRGRTCRLCGGHTGACVACSEPDCGRHFHAHCAEQFGLVVERDEPMQFKCRMHSPMEASPEATDRLMQLLNDDETQGLLSELSTHDTTVGNHKPLNFGPRPQVVAPAPPSSTYTTGRLSAANKQPVRQMTPSFAVPRPSLLPLAHPLPNYIFNYWITKRVAIGHELIPRLRVIKMDEMRKQEILDAVSDMEVNLKKMITLRLYMERIRILVDLCKKREGLKRQQLDDFANLLTLPGIGDHAREITRQVYKNGPSPYGMQTPNKSRKLSEKSTPKSLYSSAPRTLASASRGSLATSPTGQSRSLTPSGWKSLATPKSRGMSPATSPGAVRSPTSKTMKSVGVAGSPGLGAKMMKAVAKRGRPRLSPAPLPGTTPTSTPSRPGKRSSAASPMPRMAVASPVAPQQRVIGFSPSPASPVPRNAVTAPLSSSSPSYPASPLPVSPSPSNHSSHVPTAKRSTATTSPFPQSTHTTLAATAMSADRLNAATVAERNHYNHHPHLQPHRAPPVAAATAPSKVSPGSNALSSPSPSTLPSASVGAVSSLRSASHPPLSSAMAISSPSPPRNRKKRPHPGDDSEYDSEDTMKTERISPRLHPTSHVNAANTVAAATAKRTATTNGPAAVAVTPKKGVISPHSSLGSPSLKSTAATATATATNHHAKSTAASASIGLAGGEGGAKAVMKDGQSSRPPSKASSTTHAVATANKAIIPSSPSIPTSKVGQQPTFAIAGRQTPVGRQTPAKTTAGNAQASTTGTLSPSSPATSISAARTNTTATPTATVGRLTTTNKPSSVAGVAGVVVGGVGGTVQSSTAKATSSSPMAKITSSSGASSAASSTPSVPKITSSSASPPAKPTSKVTAKPTASPTKAPLASSPSRAPLASSPSRVPLSSSPPSSKTTPSLPPSSSSHHHHASKVTPSLTPSHAATTAPSKVIASTPKVTSSPLVASPKVSSAVNKVKKTSSSPVTLPSSSSSSSSLTSSVPSNSINGTKATSSALPNGSGGKKGSASASATKQVSSPSSTLKTSSSPSKASPPTSTNNTSSTPSRSSTSHASVDKSTTTAGAGRTLFPPSSSSKLNASSTPQSSASTAPSRSNASTTPSTTANTTVATARPSPRRASATSSSSVPVTSAKPPTAAVAAPPRQDPVEKSSPMPRRKKRKLQEDDEGDGGDDREKETSSSLLPLPLPSSSPSPRRPPPNSRRHPPPPPPPPPTATAVQATETAVGVGESFRDRLSSASVAASDDYSDPSSSPPLSPSVRTTRSAAAKAKAHEGFENGDASYCTIS